MRIPSARIRAAGQLGAVVAEGWLRGRGQRRMPPTWPVDARTPARMSVRWPSVYEWPAAQKWVQWLRDGMAAHLTVTPANIPQRYEGIVLIEVELDGVVHEVAIDYFDRDRVLDDVIERCPLVFKMQYRVDGYGRDHVVPGGYVPAHASLYRYLPGLRVLRERAPPRFEVYGRFGASYATGIRRQAVEMLSAQDRFSYEGSLTLLPYGTYLRETALSQVCVDLPGNGDMCHRLIDYLAIGCCVVRPEPTTRLHVPLRDGESIRFARSDLADLVDVCAGLTAEPARCAQIGLAAQDYFDRYLHPAQLTGYYIERCVSMLGASL